MNLRLHLCCILCMNLNIEHFFLFLAISVVSLSCKDYSVTVFQGPLVASSPNVSVRQNQHSIFECSLSHMAEGFLLEIWNLSCFFFSFIRELISVWFILFLQTLPSSCPYPPHLSLSDGSHPRDDIPLRRKHPLMWDSSCRHPGRAPGLL